MTLAPIQDNPVGWSSIYPPDRMGNPDPDVSPVASRALMSDVQKLGLLGRRGPVTGADLPAVEARGQGLMDNAMTVAGATNPIAKVDANWLRAALKERGLQFTEKSSTSFSDVHGPSASQYFKIGDKTVRLSDHSYGTGNAADLRYGMDATRAAQELDYALGLGPRPAPIPDPIREHVYGLTRKQLNAALDGAGIKNVSNADKESRLLEYLRSKGGGDPQ